MRRERIGRRIKRVGNKERGGDRPFPLRGTTTVVGI